MEDAKNSNSELHEIIPVPFIEGKKNCIVKKEHTYHAPQKRTVYLEKVAKNRLKNDNIQESSLLWKMETTFPKLCTEVQKKLDIWAINPKVMFAIQILLPLEGKKSY